MVSSNFRVRGISRGMYKLIRTPTLIIIKKKFRKSLDHPSTVPCIILFVESRDYRASPLYDTVAGLTRWLLNQMFE